MLHTGSCHCGAITVRFRSDRQLAPRLCMCSFCRKHGARSVSDPNGKAELALSDTVIRYRFASRAADYLICGRCGVYVGAVADIGGSSVATLNLNVFDDPRLDVGGEAVSYDVESAADKAQRRRERWTPAVLIEPPG